MTRELLTDLARRATDVDSELAETVRLAWYFDHTVTKGGFALLLHDLPVDRMEALEHMLATVAAPVAASFYRRAIECCLQDLDAYQRFRTSFAEESPLKEELHRVSLDYYGAGVDFPDEIIRWLTAASRSL